MGARIPLLLTNVGDTGNGEDQDGDFVFKVCHSKTKEQGQEGSHSGGSIESGVGY
jgi:hypothetical protein